MKKIKRLFIFYLIITLLFSNTVFASSKKKNGFITKNEKTYYYQKGIKIVNKQIRIGKYCYYFNNKGVMQTSSFKTLITKSGNKKKCYYNAKGRRVSGKKKINGDIYFFKQTNGNVMGRINKIIYMNQNLGVYQNKKWTHTDFPNTLTWNGFRFGNGACGVTSCAMAISVLKNKIILPTNFNSMKYGFNGKGSNWNVGILTAQKYGLKGKIKTFTKRELKEQILKGRYILIWVNNSIYGGKGNTSGGDIGYGGSHFILIHGYYNGKFAIADPNNLSQSYIWSKKLQNFESFNSHLGNGSKSYCLIYK